MTADPATTPSRDIKQCKYYSVRTSLYQTEMATPVVDQTQAATPDQPASALTGVERLASAIERAGLMMASHKEMASFMKDLISTLKLVQKEMLQLQKAAGSKRSGRGRGAASGSDAAAGERKPSGFATPTELSADLCSFLGVPEGTRMARTDVTRQITAYIKEHKLFNPDDKRKILPDATLRKLINWPADSDQVLTYFNLQGAIKHHYKPSTAAAPASA